jgi:hypothetical protein
MPLTINPEWGRFVGVEVTGDRSYAVLASLFGTVLRVRDVPLVSAAVDDVCDRIVHITNEVADGEAVIAIQDLLTLRTD